MEEQTQAPERNFVNILFALPFALLAALFGCILFVAWPAPGTRTCAKVFAFFAIGVLIATFWLVVLVFHPRD